MTRRRRRLVTLGASLALHGGLLLTVLLAVSGETEPGALFIDLTESASYEAGGGAAGPPAARPARREGVRAHPPIVAADSAPAPSAAPDPGEPLPPAEPASSRDSGAESPVAPAPAAPMPVGVSESDPTPRAPASPRAAGASDAGPPGASGAAEASAARAAGGSVTESEVFSGHGAPGGAPDVSRGFALAVAGGGARGGAEGALGPGAEYGAYLGRLRARVQQSLRYPLAARRRGLSGTVNVEIVIRPDGAISAVAVADSSSHAVLDEAAVETIKRLAPEPLPRDVPPRTLRVRLPVVFALE
jgi:protein TonB